MHVKIVDCFFTLTHILRCLKPLKCSKSKYVFPFLSYSDDVICLSFILKERIQLPYFPNLTEHFHIQNASREK